jgi:hypothetical protein
VNVDHGLTAPVRLSLKPATGADEIPIACTLDGGSRQRQFSEWQQLLGSESVGNVLVRTPIPGGVRLEFGDGVDPHELTRLAVAEHRCCEFFSFAITVDSRGIALEVRAPADALELVHALFGVPA